MRSAAAAHGWRFYPAPKYALHGVVRTIPPEETIKRVAPLMTTIGVTRVADVTGLDRVGLPNFTTVRPRERGEGISYYNGKGRTRADAHAGALMEAVERYSGEFCDLPVLYADRGSIEELGIAADPATLIAPRIDEYQVGRSLEWVEGFDLLSGEPTYLPLNAVVCPYDPPPGRPTLYCASSNGLASGNTLEEAVCHALCEVIERDATAIADATRDLAPAVRAMLTDLGLAAGRGQPAAAADAFPLIDLDSLPTRAMAIARRMQRAGLRVYLRDVTCTAGIATLDCSIVETQLDNHHLVHGGSGAHPDARIAASRALTEAAQSRVGHIQGGRGVVRPFSSVPSCENADVRDDIRFLLDRLRRDGFTQVVAVDLTRPELGVPVVRVVVPWAEAWSAFYTHARRAAFGPRVGEVLRHTVLGQEDGKADRCAGR